jgi:membrane protein YqaA with SNARE-associated domain
MVTPNDVLRFFLEMAALAALVYWGFSEFGGVVQWVIGLGAPLFVAVVWGRFMSPKASHPTVDPVRVLIEFTVFGSGVAALFAAGAPVLAVIFAVLAALHLSLTFALGQRPEREAAAVPPS